jgi:hypothetical protein
MKQEEQAIAFYKAVKESGSQATAITVMTCIVAEIMEETNAETVETTVRNKFGEFNVEITKIYE